VEWIAYWQPVDTDSKLN